MNNLLNIAGQFDLGGVVAGIKEFGGGKINDTFLVALTSGDRRILQRINTRIFLAPELIMENLRIITEHMAGRLPQIIVPGERWEIPRIYSAKTGQDFWQDQKGGFWRVMGFISGATAVATVQSLDHAGQAGVALGRFHRLLADLEPGRLHDTLPGFHSTPGYLRRYDQVLNKREPLPAEILPLAHFIAERREIAFLLEQRRTAGTLSQRVMHGDPRLNNIMIDAQSGRAVALIDLDTVKPGLIHYDIGDLLRSACNPAGGEAIDLNKVHFDIDLYSAILTGYLSQIRICLNADDLAAIPDSVLVIAFELGLRYFTDFLEGNVYFKAVTPEHNLRRAAVQFRLVEQIEAVLPALRQIVESVATYNHPLYSS